MSTNAAQSFVPIKEIRDGIVVMKDGSVRAILLTSSVNFALKSEDEQAALLAQFQDFLNSLDFSIQIFIQSRRLDIRPYIALLEERFKEQVNELMRIQTREYIEFVKNFTENSEIMTKRFFVVVPYSPIQLGAAGGAVAKQLSALIPGSKSSSTAEDEKTSFEEMATQLEQRVGVVAQGLVRTGIRAARLGTEEAIELFYKLFNPGELEKPIKLQSAEGRL